MSVAQAKAKRGRITLHGVRGQEREELKESQMAVEGCTVVTRQNGDVLCARRFSRRERDSVENFHSSTEAERCVEQTRGVNKISYDE